MSPGTASDALHTLRYFQNLREFVGVAASHFNQHRVVHHRVPCDHPAITTPRDIDRMTGSHLVAREEVLYHSDLARVSRRHLSGTAGTVIVKELLGADAVTRLRREVRILEQLKGVDGVSQLTAVDARCNAIIVEDVHGVSFSHILRTERLDVRSQVLLMLQLAQIIAAVHRRGIVHKDINPMHVMLSGVQRRPTLVHFERATTAGELHGALVDPRKIAGTLTYLAPELTGRTGRSIDHRADLYALGVTFYEMSTGHPPFADADPLRLIHDILARVPEPPINHDRSMPPALSDIIMRLLEKEPDRRYQSAEGLAHDLSKLCDAIEGEGATSFPLGESDFAPRLLAPSRLMGREAEIDALKEAFEASLHTGSRGVLICGAAGVGKSALLNELRSMVTARRGWFVMGKFAQHRHDLESDAAYQAMRALGQLLLAEPEVELATLRADILRASRGKPEEFVGFLPEFAVLLGVSPTVATGGDPLQKAQQAIQMTVELVRAIASPARPVVMALDDLQWAPSTSLGFVDAILRDERLRGLLLVCAFQEADMEVNQPLAALLSRWEQLQSRPLQLQLGNLAPAQLDMLLEEMLRLPPEQASMLAGVVSERTGGNPYDTVELVNALRHDRLLVPGKAGWSWDAEEIRRYISSSEVTEVLATRIERLPQHARAVLELMACLSGKLEFSLLHAASGLIGAELNEQLAPALQEGLLVLDPQGHGTIQFRNSRVQQVAYESLEPAARQHLHLTLARRLAQHPQFEALAAEQYLPAMETLHDPNERRRVATLLRATASSVRSIDAKAAECFLAAALATLRPVADTTDSALLLALEVERHAVLSSLGRLEEADAAYRTIERDCANPLELTAAACVQLKSLCYRRRYREAFEMGFELLAQLGWEPPPADSLDAELERRLGEMREWLARLDLTVELQRAPVTDVRVLAAAEIRSYLLTSAFTLNKPVAFWLVLESQRHLAEYGPCTTLINHLSVVPLALVGACGDHRAAYTLLKQVMKVGAYGDEQAMRHLRWNAVFIEHWTESLAADVEKCDQVRTEFLKAGDDRQACIVHHISIAALFDCAPRLEACALDVEAALALAARLADENSTMVFTLFRELLRSLRGEPDGACDLTKYDLDEGRYRANLAESPVVSAFFHINRALGAALLTGASQESTDLLHHAAAGMRLVQHISLHTHSALAHFLQALALASRARTASSDERAALLEELVASRNWLAARAQDAPDNFLNLLRLVDAEHAWAAGDFKGAMTAFDIALHQIKRVERPWHVAFITERAAMFHLAHGLEHTGRKLLRDARLCYHTWGATEKVRALDQAHAFLRADESVLSQVTREGGGVSADTIDMLAVLRASQALSSETALHKLETRVVELLSAMTGATRVLFIARGEDPAGWFLAATADERGEVISVDEAGARGMLPLSAFRYAERTREPLLLEDATRDDRFARDPYLAGLDRCSLLVAPIFSQGLPRAVLLLESQSARGAFSADRLDAVMLIAGQLGVSLDNAQRYEFLERNVAERTAELANSLALIRAALEAASDALVATDGNGKVTAFNELYLRMWDIPRERLEQCNGRDAFKLIRGHLKDPEQALAQLQQLQAHPDEESSGTLELSDGRVFEERSRPQRIGPTRVGRVWSFHEITERRRAEAELQTVHQQLVEASRQGGMAEVATNVLHNVGNVLTSVNVSATVVTDSLRKSKTSGLARVAALLQEHEHDLGTFIRSERGQQLPGYLAQLAQHLQADQESSLQELDLLRSHIDHIREIVTMQQSYARVSAIKETVRVSDLVEDSLRLNLGALTRHGVQIIREFEELPPMQLEKHKVLQILVNLISNAKYACDDSGVKDKRVALRISTDVETGQVCIAVQDNGVGIPKENLSRIFNHGFTTRATGHGFGLHSSALAAREISGALRVHSDGVGKGATFTLELPLEPTRVA